MTLTNHKGNYAFDSRLFELDGANYEITGDNIDRFDNIILHIKNLDTGKHGEFGRERLVKILIDRGTEVKPFRKR